MSLVNNLNYHAKRYPVSEFSKIGNSTFSSFKFNLMCEITAAYERLQDHR